MARREPDDLTGEAVEVPDRPIFHVAPPRGWVNDPNGPFWYRGLYHMFYQYLPEGCEWAFGLAWGHAVSADLSTWRHLPPALVPTPAFLDADGCFSGCATLDEDGIPVILYTGVRLRSNPDAGPLPPPECDLGLPFVESQLFAVPVDPSDPELREWTKIAAPFLPLPPPDANLTGWRDPFVVERPSDANGQEWVVLIGAGVKGLGGTAAVYRARRLRDAATWRFDGWLCEGDGATGTVWECPLVARLRQLPAEVAEAAGAGGAAGGGGGGERTAAAARPRFSFSGDGGGGGGGGDSDSLFGSELGLLAPPPPGRRRPTPPLPPGGGSSAADDAASTGTRALTPPLPPLHHSGAGGESQGDGAADPSSPRHPHHHHPPPTHFYSISPDAATNPTIYWVGSYRSGRFDLPRALGPFRLDLGDVLYAPNVLEDGGVSGRGPADDASAPLPPQQPLPLPLPAAGAGSAGHKRERDASSSSSTAFAAGVVASAAANGKAEEEQEGEDPQQHQPPFPSSPAAAATNGRTLLWGWVQERRGVGAWDYAGCLSTPRVLWLHGDRLWQEPAPEVTALRKPGASWRAREIPLVAGAPPVPLPGSAVCGAHLDLELTFRPGTARTVGVMLRSWNASDAGGAAVLFTWGGGLVAEDGTPLPVGGPGASASYTAPDAAASAAAARRLEGGLASALEVAFEALDPATMSYSLLAPGARRTGGRVHVGPRDRARLRILIDDSVLEVFTGSGEVLTTRVYRGQAPAHAHGGGGVGGAPSSAAAGCGNDSGVEFFALDGEATLESVEAHEVATIWQREGVSDVRQAAASLSRAASGAVAAAAAPPSPAAAAKPPDSAAAALSLSSPRSASLPHQASLRVVADGSADALAQAAAAAATADEVRRLQRLLSDAALIGGGGGGEGGGGEGGGFDSVAAAAAAADDAAAEAALVEGVPEEEMTADIFVLG